MIFAMLVWRSPTLWDYTVDLELGTFVFLDEPDDLYFLAGTGWSVG